MRKRITDLTKRPPRSPRVRLGGYATLPRLLDKCRATLAGKNGEYHYNCPVDQRFLQFVGISAKAVREKVASGEGDQKILEWIQANAAQKRSRKEILAWSAGQEQRVPDDAESRKFFAETLAKLNPERKDVTTWFDLLDLDDYVSFGGNP